MFHYGSLERFGGLSGPLIVGGSAAGGGSAHPLFCKHLLSMTAVGSSSTDYGSEVTTLILAIANP